MAAGSGLFTLGVFFAGGRGGKLGGLERLEEGAQDYLGEWKVCLRLGLGAGLMGWRELGGRETSLDGEKRTYLAGLGGWRGGFEDYTPASTI